MKKIGNKTYDDFPTSTLYLDDLRDIVKVFEEVCTEVTVKSGGNEIEGSAEIEALAKSFSRGRFDDIRIQGYGPFVSLGMGPRTAWAYISEDDAVQVGLIAQVREIFLRGKRWRKTGWAYGPSFVFSGFTGYLFAQAVLEPGREHALAALAATAVAIVLAIVSTVIVFRTRSIIVRTEERSAHSTFLSRNRDKLALVVLGALLGAISTGLVTWIITATLSTGAPQ